MEKKVVSVAIVILTDCFSKWCVPEVMIVDNAFGYADLQHGNLQGLFLPPKTKSLIEPHDQRIIVTFITSYIKRTIQYILDNIENFKILSVIDAWKKLYDCKAIWPECGKTKVMCLQIRTSIPL